MASEQRTEPGDSTNAAALNSDKEVMQRKAVRVRLRQDPPVIADRVQDGEIPDPMRSVP